MLACAFSFYAPTFAATDICSLYKNLNQHVLPDIDGKNLRIMREEVDAILRDATLNDRAKAKKVKELYLAHRLSLLPEDFRKVVEKKHKDLKTIYEDSGSFREIWPHLLKGDHYNARTNTIVIISLPLKYKNSLVAFFAEAHELEHMIQAAAAEFYGARPPFFLKSARAEMNFLMEQGAMTAENHFIQILPEDRLSSIRDIIKADKNIDEDERKFLLRNLAHRSNKDHLEKQRRSGRYTKKSFDDELRSNRREAAINLGLIAVTSISSLAWYCSDVMKRPKQDASQTLPYETCKKMEELFGE